ncbi:MAG: hypothetical protein ABI536_01090 [Gallionella sp.]
MDTARRACVVVADLSAIQPGRHPCGGFCPPYNTEEYNIVKNGMRPIHPGEILREEYLAPMGMSIPRDFGSWII